MDAAGGDTCGGIGDAAAAGDGEDSKIAAGGEWRAVHRAPVEVAEGERGFTGGFVRWISGRNGPRCGEERALFWVEGPLFVWRAGAAGDRGGVEEGAAGAGEGVFDVVRRFVFVVRLCGCG